jgi:excisionase family DNA binding protein
VLTTGEVARICHVAPRTVSKWFDSGKLRGWRVPGSRDRRIPVAQLIAFMRAHGIPLDGLDGGLCRVLIVDAMAPGGLAEALNASDRYDAHVAANEFEAGMLAEQLSPHVIVVDVGADEDAAAEVCRNIKASAAFGTAKVIATGEQIDRSCTQRLSAFGFDTCLRKPYSPAELVRAIEEATNLVT